jgi:hypothetical protein
VKCKWRTEKLGLEILSALYEKTELFPNTRLTYVLYSKSGFTQEVYQKAKNMDYILLYGLNSF